MKPKRYISSYLRVLLTFLVVGICLVGALGSSFDGTLTVMHKLTKKTVMTIHNVKQNSIEPLIKASMFVSSPLDACSKLDHLPDTTGLHFLTADSVSMRLPVLLVQDGNCDIEHKLVNAHHAGYAGVILSTEKNYRDINAEYSSTIPGVFLALVSLTEGQLLQKFAKNSYIFQFHRNPFLSEQLYNIAAKIVQHIFESGRNLWSFCAQIISYNLSGIIGTILLNSLQIALLLLPLAFLSFFVVEKEDVPSTYEEEYRFFSWDSARERRYKRWENVNHDEMNSSDDEVSLQRYRDMLGVPVGATRRDIETEFRRKSFEFHPDKNMHLSVDDRDRKAKHFKDLNAAKAALLNVLER